MNNKKSTILVAALSLSFVLSTQSVLAVEDQAGQAGYVSETDSSGQAADTDLIFTIDQQIKLSSAGYSAEDILALDKKARDEKAALGQDFDLVKFVKDKIEEKKREKENTGLEISDPVSNEGVGSPNGKDRGAVDASSSATYYKKANWENKIKDKSRWKVEDAQNLVRVGGGDPLQMNDIDYDGMFIDGNGRYVIRLVYKEKSQALSGVWYRALINFGDLDKYIDYDLSYVLGKDGKTQYKFEDVQNVVGKGFDLGKAAGDRTNNRANLPINLVLKEGIDLKTLGNKNYIVQMRITDGNYNRVYAYAPGKTSMDYSTYTKTTAVDLADKLGTLFIKGGKQSDLNNATNQEFFMSEFIANPDQYDDKLNLGIIRTQYMGQTNTIVRETVGGQPIAFTQVFDANLVNYLKADKAGNVAYVNVLTNGRVLSPVTKNVGIPLDKINYSKDRKLAYIVIGTEAFKKDGVQVVTVPKLDQHVMLSGFYITAIDYVVDKGKFEDTFAGRTQGIDKTRKLNYSMMSGWTNPNNDGWTIYEKDYDDDYVVPEGDSYLIDTGEDPTGGQIMLQIGGEQAILRKPQGYYNGYVSGSGANDAIEKYANGVYEIKLREGATILKGKKLKLYMPYTSSHNKQVNFLEIHNGTKKNEGGATLTLNKDRNITMHIFKQGKKGHFVLKYTLADGTESSMEFTPKVLWKYSDKDRILTGVPNTSADGAGGNFYINTKKLKTGADIFVESYDAKGNKIDSETSWFKYKPLEKSKGNVKLLTWTDHSDKKSVLSINKSLYTPYQQIFTNDYAGGNVYENSKALPADEAAFNTDTTQIVGYTKYDGGKVRTLFEGGKTGNFIAKVEADANKYNDKGELDGKDVRKDITIKKDNIFDPHFDGNNKTYKAYQYRVDLAKMLAYHSDDDKTEHKLKLLKDMKFVSTASDGSSLPSDLYETRVRTRVLFDANTGKLTEAGNQVDKVVKIAPDNTKFYGEVGYVANGFEGANVEANTGDKFPEDPKLDGKNFLGWVTEAGKQALGNKAVVTADKFNALSKDQIFTNETPITKHLVVYAIYSEDVTVTFDANQGKFTDGKDTTNVEVKGGSVTEPTPTREGFTFKGWAADKNATEADANILNNVNAPKTVYAVWEKKDKEQLQLKEPTPVEVKDTKSLTSDEIDKVKKAVAEANKDKGIKESDITVAEDGTVTVIKDGKTGTLAPEKTVKQKEVQNQFNPPKEPVKVENAKALNDTEKQAVKDAIKAANKDRNFTNEDITVNDDGSVKINQGGKVGSFTPEQTVVQKDTILDLNKPSEKVEVKNPANLTQKEKDEVAKKVKDANRDKLTNDADVKVDSKGNVTVTTTDGKTGTLKAEDTVKPFTREGKTLNPPANKVKVGDTDKLTEAEKQAVRDEIKKANPDLGLTDADIDVDPNGTVSVQMGTNTAFIQPTQTVEEAQDSDNTIKLVAPAKIPVENKNSLNVEEKAKVVAAVKAANDTLNLENNDIKVANDGSVTVEKNGKTGQLAQADTVVEKLKKPEAKALSDGSVVVRPKDERTEELEITFGTTTVIAKKENGKWKLADGTDQSIRIDKESGLVTIPAKMLKNNDEVKAKAKAAELKSEEATVSSKDDEAPASPEISEGDDGNVTITIPKDEDAKTVDIEYKDNNGVYKSVTATKDASGTWKLGDNTPQGISIKDGKITIPADMVKNGTDVSAKAVDTNDNESSTRTLRIKTDADKTEPKIPAKTKVGNPSSLTPEEIAQVKKAIEDANKDGLGNSTLPTNTNITVGTDGTATITYPDESKDTIKGTNLVEKSEETKIKAPAAPITVDNAKALTEQNKKDVEEAVRNANKDSSGKSTLPEGATINVSDDGTVTIKDKTGKVIGTISADKTVKQNESKLGVKAPTPVEVADPENVKPEEQGKIKEAVIAANPDLADATITVDNKGNVTVTKDGKTGKLSPEQTVKKAGAIVAPTTPVEVKDPSKLTDKEKEAVKKAVNDANPTLPEGATIEVGNDGTVTVKKGGKEIGKLTPAQTVKKAQTGGSTGGSTGPVIPPISDGSGSDDSGDADEDSSLKPIDKVEVKDKDKLTDAEKKEISDRIKAKNPGITDVEVDDKGNVTVTKKDGTKTNVPAGDVLKEAESKNPIQPIDKVEVKDKDKLTDAEKKEIADRIKEKNPGIKDVEVDDKGNVEITNKDGSKTKISAKDVLSEAKDVKVVIPKDKVKVKDLDKLTEAEKKSLLDKVKKANPNAIKVEFDDKGNIVLTFDNGLMTSLPYRNLVTKVQKGAVMVPHKSKSEGEAPLRNRKGNKGARNVKTGVSEVGGLFGVVGTAIAGLFVTRKKEDEEEK